MKCCIMIAKYAFSNFDGGFAAESPPGTTETQIGCLRVANPRRRGRAEIGGVKRLEKGLTPLHSLL